MFTLCRVNMYLWVLQWTKITQHYYNCSTEVVLIICQQTLLKLLIIKIEGGAVNNRANNPSTNTIKTVQRKLNLNTSNDWTMQSCLPLNNGDDDEEGGWRRWRWWLNAGHRKRRLPEDDWMMVVEGQSPEERRLSEQREFWNQTRVLKFLVFDYRKISRLILEDGGTLRGEMRN